MRRLLTTGLLTTLAVFCPPAAAQYYIGDYYYSCPAGAQWNDARCTRELVEEPEDSVNQATSVLLSSAKTWGSVYIDESTGALGATTQARDALSAEAVARGRCEAGGNVNCKKRLTFANQCVAVAWPTGPGRVVVQTAESVGVAGPLALRACGPSGEACEIAYSSCALP